MAGHKSYEKKSPYSFWVGAVGKTRTISQKNPNDDIKIIPAKSLGREDQLESLKDPQGEEYAVVSSRRVTPQSEATNATTASDWVIPFEKSVKRENSDYLEERGDFFNVFGEDTHEKPPNTYVLSATNITLLFDANDATALKTGRLAGTVGVMIKSSINHEPLAQLSTVSLDARINKAKASALTDEQAKYMKIHGLDFNSVILQQVGGILRARSEGHKLNIYDPVEYMPKGRSESVGALPISDGQGHFVIIASAHDANGVDLF